MPPDLDQRHGGVDRTMQQSIRTNHGINPPGGIPGVDRPRWIKDNGDGLNAERANAAVFKNIGFLVTKMADRRADLSIVGKIEVKRDRLAHKTGRVAIEIKHHGRPSGLSTSIATTWSIVSRDEIILVETSRLRAAVKALPDTRAGEDAVVRLLPLSDLRRIGVCVAGTEGK